MTLLHRPDPFVLGLLLGVVVIAAFVVLNERVGVVGGFADFVERVTGRRAALGWKAWFVIGVVGGGLLFRLLAGAPTVRHGFGWLTRNLDGGLVAGVPVPAGGAGGGGGAGGRGAAPAGGAGGGGARAGPGG